MYSREIYRQVAQLHAANIDKGFLCSLGTSFLALLYEAIDRSEGGVLLVALRDDQVVGFVAGTQGMRAIYGQLLRRWPSLMIALLPAFASPRKLWKIGEIVRMRKKQQRLSNLPQAELLSIAVDPAQRRSGHAQILYQGLVNHFRERKVGRFRIVVGAPLAAAHRFYLKMGAQTAGRIVVHRGQESVMYVHETLRQLPS